MNQERSSAAVQKACVEAFAHHLVTALINLELHPVDSPHVESNLAALIQELREAERRGVPMPFRLWFDGDCIRHQDDPLMTASLQARRLLDRCTDCDIVALAFQPRLELDELLRFLELLGEDGDALQRSFADLALAARGVRRVEVTFAQDVGLGERTAPGAACDQDVLRGYQELADCVHQAHVRAHRDLDVGVDFANGAVERTLGLLAMEPSGLLSLACHDNIDRFTVGHSVRVTLLALQAARAAGASRHELVTVGTAALLHDIGKSKIPQEVLFKQGPLDEREWEEMAQHPRLGAQVLLEQEELDPISIGAAFCHHMKPCGSGYPTPAFPFQPSGVSRLVRICDVFEALTSVRPYKKALTPVEAYAVMFREEGFYDPTWLRFFVDTLGLYPQGTRLQLDDGTEAIVVDQGPTPDQPVVHLLSGPAGTDLPMDAPDRILVGQPLEGVTRRILRVLQHDRNVIVTDLADAEILTQEPQHRCR